MRFLSSRWSRISGFARMSLLVFFWRSRSGLRVRRAVLSILVRFARVSSVVCLFFRSVVRVL